MTNSYDPQREPYAAFPIQAGPKGRVIKGWQEGLIGLRKGSHVRLIIPTSLGWGEAGSGDVIPSNAEILFDIWVEDIQFLNL
jgi:peptidyl-prolyl cis-trans isomerase A (cyclophilin A)